jgi:hypothetical protein
VGTKIKLKSLKQKVKKEIGKIIDLAVHALEPSSSLIHYFFAVSENSLNLFFYTFLKFFLESFIPVKKNSRFCLLIL